MTTPQMDWLDDQRRKRAVSSDDIVKRLRTVQTFTADNCEELSLITDQAADQIERLRAAGDALVAAIRNHDLTEQSIRAWEEARRG